MTRIKICGLRRLEDADYLNEVMPDYAGFVFWEKSKRNLSFEQAKEIRERLNPKIKSIGVFVDRDRKDMIKLVRDGIVSGIQLHGSESAETVRFLKEELGEDVFIIKAFEIKSEADLLSAADFPSDEILIDSGKGSGETFNWELLSRLDRRYFLAGGLNIANAGEAVRKLHPYAVDVSSGVETDGYKDRDKIKEFCEAVRLADGR